MSKLYLVPRLRQKLFPLDDAWTDFVFSRQAMLVSPKTIRTYRTQ